MHFSTLLALLPAVLAAPASIAGAARDTTSAYPTTTPANPPVLYYLRTSVTSGNKDKDNLYLQSYHTGAGTADATFVPKNTTEYVNIQGYLNGTTWQFSLPSTDNYELGLDPYGDANEAIWETVAINSIEAPRPGFYFNSTEGAGLRWNSEYPFEGTADSEFVSWLVCDWYHGLPQLFWRVKGFSGFVPKSCSEVELIPEPVYAA